MSLSEVKRFVFIPSNAGGGGVTVTDVNPKLRPPENQWIRCA